MFYKVEMFWMIGGCWSFNFRVEDMIRFYLVDNEDFVDEIFVGVG